MGDYKDTHGKTKLGEFLRKVSSVIPIPEAITSLATGNILSAFKIVKDSLVKHSSNNAEARKLLDELELRREELELDAFEIMIKDKDSARDREVEMAKSGKTDWLMYASGITGLGTFCVTVYSILFREIPESALLHQLIGMIEGIAVTIFAYYFGASKKED